MSATHLTLSREDVIDFAESKIARIKRSNLGYNNPPLPETISLAEEANTLLDEVVNLLKQDSQKQNSVLVLGKLAQATELRSQITLNPNGCPTSTDLRNLISADFYGIPVLKHRGNTIKKILAIGAGGAVTVASIIGLRGCHHHTDHIAPVEQKTAAPSR